MYKIILPFALLFCLLFINSCRYDDTVSQQDKTYKLLSWIEVYKYDNDSRTNQMNLEYTGNNITKFSFNSNNSNVTDINISYDNDKIKSCNYTQLQNGTVVNYELIFNYENAKLVELFNKSNGNVLSKTIYKYSNNNLSEVIKTDFNSNLVTDSTYCNEFIDGRPGNISFYRRANVGAGVFKLKLMEVEKFIYSNGNLIEKYENWNGTTDLYLALKKEYNLKEKSLFSFFREPYLIMNSKYPYIPNNIDKNLELKNDYYTTRCNGFNYNQGVIYSSNPITYTYNSKKLIEKLTSPEIPFCGQSGNSTTEVTFTWE